MARDGDTDIAHCHSHHYIGQVSHTHYGSLKVSGSFIEECGQEYRPSSTDVDQVSGMSAK
jgi:hypothetical protein